MSFLIFTDIKPPLPAWPWGSQDGPDKEIRTDCWLGRHCCGLPGDSLWLDYRGHSHTVCLWCAQEDWGCQVERRIDKLNYSICIFQASSHWRTVTTSLTNYLHPNVSHLASTRQSPSTSAPPRPQGTSAVVTAGGLSSLWTRITSEYRGKHKIIKISLNYQNFNYFKF